MAHASLIIATLAGISLATAAPARADIHDHAEAAAKLAQEFTGSALQRAAAKLAQELAVGAVQRARQAIAVGPVVGGFGGARGGDGIGGVTFGLGIYTFDRPSILQLQDIIAEKLQARLTQYLASAVATGGQSMSEADVLAQVVADVKAEVLGEARVQTFEKPSLGVVLEGAVVTDGWSTRLGVSKGVGFASLGLGAGFMRASGDTIPFVGLDLSVRATPIGVHRTPVIELYVRGDVGFADAGRQGMYVGGLRVLLDVL